MVQLKEIKNIIFDLGDVIININPHNATSAFQLLLGNNFDAFEKKLSDNKLLEKYETANISTDQFISFFKGFQPSLTENEIINAWDSMLLDIPKERLNLIHQLAKKYRVFLLSNTNEIHLKHINDYLFNEFGINDISILFEKAYYSHQMGLRKPNPKIFETILADKNLIAEETLFIDDSEEHIITAKQLHLNTHHLTKGETITDIFNVN